MSPDPILLSRLQFAWVIGWHILMPDLVPLGSRALEILISLLERRGVLVRNRALTARVWPNLCVDPSNLTVQMSALRRALRDGQNVNRFIVNIPGRGCCFVAPVEVSGDKR